MLKSDARRIADLGSASEDARRAAAAALSAHPRGHFDAHPIDKLVLEPAALEALQAAWRATGDPAVRAWIAQVLVLSGCTAPAAFGIVRDAMDLACEHQHRLLHYVLVRTTLLPDVRALLRRYHRHRSSDMRLCCASRLASMALSGELDRADDGELLRALALDADGSVRTYAALALQRIADQLQPVDFELLLDVENIDAGAARTYARQAMAKIAARLPVCTAAAFAPRLPLLRTDGVYRAGCEGADAAGRPLSSACLRFTADGAVRWHATGIAPVDFQQLLPAEWQRSPQGRYTLDRGLLRFALRHDDGSVTRHEGTVDGDAFRLVTIGADGTAAPPVRYAWRALDWDAPSPPPAAASMVAPRRAARRGAARLLPFEVPRPRSLSLSQARAWYLEMVGRLPEFLADAPAPPQRLARAWELKHAAREVAADAAIDRKLKDAFLARFPLPALEELQAAHDADAALAALLTIAPRDVAAYPATVGVAVGTRVAYGRQRFVVTDRGWEPEAPGRAAEAGGDGGR
ncbi:MAG: hypothetical protein PGN26_00970 [Xylophilus ampelinus]